MIDEWRDLNNLSSLHNFLEWGGVVSNYVLNEAEFSRLVGAAIKDVTTLETFSQATRSCFEALIRLGGSATAGDMRTIVESQLGRLLDVHQMPATLKPLLDANLVTFAGKKGDKQSLYSVASAEKAAALARVAADLSLSGVVPDAVFQNTFGWIVKRLKQKNLTKDERGRTLEILAAKICWRLGLRHIQIRHRTEFEVDVVADRVGMGFQRWSVQCKAYGDATIRSEHILREFGIAALVGYDVLLFVTTSNFSRDAMRTLTSIIRKTNVLVLPISGADLDSFAENESRIFSFLETQSHEARRLRLGSPPAAIFRELDSTKSFILSEKPTATELWARLQRRDIFVELDVFVPLFVAWLESQHDAANFDPAYLAQVRTLA